MTIYNKYAHDIDVSISGWGGEASLDWYKIAPGDSESWSRSSDDFRGYILAVRLAQSSGSDDWFYNAPYWVTGENDLIISESDSQDDEKGFLSVTTTPQSSQPNTRLRPAYLNTF
jgi:hypothetical protein